MLIWKNLFETHRSSLTKKIHMHGLFGVTRDAIISHVDVAR